MSIKFIYIINFDTSNYIQSSFNDTIVLRCTRYVTHTRAGTQSWKVCVVCIWCGMVTHDVYSTKRTPIVKLRHVYI